MAEWPKSKSGADRSIKLALRNGISKKAGGGDARAKYHASRSLQRRSAFIKNVERRSNQLKAIDRVLKRKRALARSARSSKSSSTSGS